MKKAVISATLGLSVIASSLAVSEPASAFQLMNFANQTLFMGVAAGTPVAGTHFITWTRDNPQSANQTFSTSNSFVTTASSVVAGQTITLFNSVATNAVVDISGSKAGDNTSVVVGYAANGVPSTKQTWFVDTSQIMFINNGATPCFRFINSTSPNEAMGIQGGNLNKQIPIITWHTFSDWWNHMDQFWCPVD